MYTFFVLQVDSVSVSGVNSPMYALFDFDLDTCEALCEALHM